MLARSLLPLALLAGIAQAASLPLTPGTFVRVDTPCDDPPFAAMFDYDGKQFSYPHASRCHSAILSKHGHSYRVRETCAALGDGSPAHPTSTINRYTIIARNRLALRAADRGESIAYRRCPAARGKAGA